MAESVAYLLIYHGSTDPRPEQAAISLAHQFAARILHSPALSKPASGWELFPESTATTAPSPTPALPLVEVAMLETGPLSLHQQILKFGQRFLQAKHTRTVRIKLLPLFLLPGMHVMEDLPREVGQAAQKLEDSVALELCPYLGSHPRLRRILTEQMAPLPAEAWVLLAHGSRRPGANQPIEALATHLGAIAAYWSTAPNLEARLQELVEAGCRQIGVLPYFLFAGGITDAISQQVQAFAEGYPDVMIHLRPPLANSAALADLLVDLATTTSPPTLAPLHF